MSFSQGSLGKVLPPPVWARGRMGLGWSPRKPPSAAPLKMHEHPFCTQGSHLATPLIAQSPPTAHIWEGDNGSTGPSLSQATPWGVPPSFPPPGRSNQGGRVNSVLQLWPQWGKGAMTDQMQSHPGLSDCRREAQGAGMIPFLCHSFNKPRAGPGSTDGSSSDQKVCHAGQWEP